MKFTPKILKEVGKVLKKFIKKFAPRKKLKLYLAQFMYRFNIKPESWFQTFLDMIASLTEVKYFEKFDVIK